MLRIEPSADHTTAAHRIDATTWFGKPDGVRIVPVVPAEVQRTDALTPTPGLWTVGAARGPRAAGPGRQGRPDVALNPTSPGDPMLDHALATVAASRPAKPEQLIAKLRRRLRSMLLERLSAAGALRRSTRRRLGGRGGEEGHRRGQCQRGRRHCDRRRRRRELGKLGGRVIDAEPRQLGAGDTPRPTFFAIGLVVVAVTSHRRAVGELEQVLHRPDSGR